MIKHVLLALAGAALGVAVCSVGSTAQTPAQVLPLGTVTQVGNPRPCPPNQGWDDQHHMSCVDAVVANCPGAEDLTLTYGYERNTRSTYLGTVVLFSGWGGTVPASDPEGLTFAQDYYNQGFEVVMLAWSSDWELTRNPLRHNSYGNIQTAACRPATFLNYVYTNPNLYTQGPMNGMCAQGFSAGSAAIGYSLAWYGAGSYLDNAELLAGPVFSSLDQGCEVPVAPDVTVCPSGQQGCVGWPSRPLQLTPEFIQGYEKGPREWTGIKACAGHQRTDQYNAIWSNMSIVSSSSTEQQFSYPGTSLAGWLCATTKPPVQMNNSTPQGELFYQQINHVTQNYSVNAIYACTSAEEVAGQGAHTSGGQSGLSAIEVDTFANCKRKVH